MINLTTDLVHLRDNDVRRSAHSVLTHRIACNFHAASEGIDVAAVIEHLLKNVPEPHSV